jgi:hypothetical protein
MPARRYLGLWSKQPLPFAVSDIRGAEMRPPDNAHSRLIIRVPIGCVDAA